MRRTLPALLLASTLLAGCATPWVVDSKVTTYSKLSAPPATPTYRFERLPSQQALPASQDALEAMAAPALAQAGLRRDDTAPRLSAQVAARVVVELSPLADPWMYGPWPGWGWGGRRAMWGPGWYGPGWYGPGFPPPSPPWFVREVSVVLRELPGNQVVYETRAFNDGPNSDNAAVLSVMFQAAMQGFPNPPQGARRVDLQIPVAHE